LPVFGPAKRPAKSSSARSAGRRRALGRDPRGGDAEAERLDRRRDRRAELEQDLSEILNATVRVKCVRQAGVPDAVTDDPMLRAAIDTLGRPDRIMEIE